MLISNKIFSFYVCAESEKEAYIKGCKKIARFAASRNEYQSVSVKIERDALRGGFWFSLYADIDLSKEMQHYCKMCKEYHSSFFINEEYNCARCNLKNFMSRTKDKSKVSKNFYQEMIKNKGGT